MDLLMKAATLVAVAFATVSSFPSPAQPQQDQQQQQTTTPTQQTPPASATPGVSHPPTPTQAQPAPEMQMQPVKGALVSNLDSKSAKQGDSVVLTTEEAVKTASGTEIPQGSKLIGHVTNVEPRSQSRENSQIAIQFDRAELKTGQNLPIQSVIQSVAPATGGATGNDTGMPPSSAAGAPATGSATRGSANPTTANNGTPQSSAGNRPAPETNVGSNTTAQSGASDQSANSGAPAPGTVVARTGNVAIRVTAIPGVLLANSITGQPFVNASGLLLGARQDIHLDGGTQIVVAVVEAPHAPGDGMSR